MADAYDGRATIEASFCQDKQGLGVVKRRQHTWEAQQIVLLLARLAHHLLLWSKWWLSRVPATRRRLRGYGIVRLLQEVGTVPGVTRWRPEDAPALVSGAWCTSAGRRYGGR